jgi:uncharacterized protein
VREIPNAWIPLSDDCKLSVRIWLPDDAEDNPVPAILEYLPYRKNDGTARRDAVHHPYFAGHGYAAVRVDMRGSGDSDSILLDEYLPQEQKDAVEVLAWLARQSWCTGDVGMIGISWGGFNGLQVAALQPPELKAVISLCSTDDRYADDVHYMGGCVLAEQMLPWASTMLAYNARPPDPAVVGERWREMWVRRMEQTPPFIETWLAHQHRDAYWKQGSICEDFSRVTCPVYAVGGWADAYSNAIPRLLEGLSVPRKGLIGPWAHLYPEQGAPGPEIGFLQECLRWWDYWLKGLDTGVMDEPMLRVWMQDSVPPSSSYSLRPGRWVAEISWPSSNIGTKRLALGRDGLTEEGTEEARFDIIGRQSTGSDAGRWLRFGSGPEFPPDQRADMGSSLTFASQPLAERLEILGFPMVTLALASDRPNALVAAWLCDVAPTGESTLVTRGLLNLTHRDSHEEPTPLEPGEHYTISIRLDAIAHAFPRGHRLCVAVSPTYWPQAWPSPEPVRLSLFAGDDSRIELPVRGKRAEDAQLHPFEPPEGSAPLCVEPITGASSSAVAMGAISGAVTSRDIASERSELRITESPGGWRRLSDGLEYETHGTDTFTIRDDEPLSAAVRCERMARIARGNWRTRVETTSKMSSNDESFIVTNIVEAFETDVHVFSKTWTTVLPRDLV